MLHVYLPSNNHKRKRHNQKHLGLLSTIFFIGLTALFGCRTNNSAPTEKPTIILHSNGNITLTKTNKSSKANLSNKESYHNEKKKLALHSTKDIVEFASDKAEEAADNKHQTHEPKPPDPEPTTQNKKELLFAQRSSNRNKRFIDSKHRHWMRLVQAQKLTMEQVGKQWKKAVNKDSQPKATIEFRDDSNLLSKDSENGLLLAIAVGPNIELPDNSLWKTKTVNSLSTLENVFALPIKPGEPFEVPLGKEGKTLVILALLSEDEVSSIEPKATECSQLTNILQSSYFVVSKTFLPKELESSPVLQPIRASALDPTASHQVSRRSKRTIENIPYVIPFTALDAKQRPYVSSKSTSPDNLSIADVIPLVVVGLSRFSSTMGEISALKNVDNLSDPKEAYCQKIDTSEILKHIQKTITSDHTTVFVTAKVPEAGGSTEITLCDTEGCPAGKGKIFARATLKSQRALVRPSLAVAFGSATYASGSALASSGYEWTKAESAGGPDDIFVLTSTEQPLAQMQTALSIGLNIDFGSAEQRDYLKGVHIGAVPLSLTGLTLTPTPQLGALASLRVYKSLGFGAMAFTRQIDALASGEFEVGDISLVEAGKTPTTPRTIKVWDNFFAVGITVDLEGSGKATRDAITKRFGGSK